MVHLRREAAVARGSPDKEEVPGFESRIAHFFRGGLDALQRVLDPASEDPLARNGNLGRTCSVGSLPGLHLDEGAALALGEDGAGVGAGIHAADEKLLAGDHTVDLEGGLELGHGPGPLLDVADVAPLLEVAVDALEGDRVRPPLGLAVRIGGEVPDDLEGASMKACWRHSIGTDIASGTPAPGPWEPCGRSYNPCGPPEETFVQRMTIYGVSFDMVGKQPIVLLKTVDGNKFLPIWIGHPEAAAILMKLQGASTPRPMTHDLLSDVLDQMEAKCEKVSVTELRDNTFFASITISMNGSELEIDSRPSDALALAVRTSAPIFAADDVIEESAIEFEGEEVEDQEQVVEKFKDFLDNVTPEDFAQGEEASGHEGAPVSEGGAQRRVAARWSRLREPCRAIRSTSWVKSIPAASAAIGKRLVSVRPGIAFTSRTCGPSSPSIRSTRAKPLQPSVS